MKNIFLKILRWWLSPKLVDEHVLLKEKPDSFTKSVRALFVHFLVHPIKRRLAKYYVVLLKKFFGLKVVAITGSAGKTTTKEMVKSILSKKGPTIASSKNIDPVYNIPSTVLRCRPSTRFLVLEMGVEFKNEMDFYFWLVKPDVGVVLNVFPTHTEFFGDEKGVFEEKKKMVQFLTKKDIAILNKSNKWTKKMAGFTRAEVVFFGEGSDIFAKDYKLDRNFRSLFRIHLGEENLRMKLPIPGRQFVENALAASAVGNVLGIPSKDIVQGLENFELQSHRMKVRKTRKSNILIDETYNSNPEALKKAIDTFNELSFGKKKMLVLGDMLELGEIDRKSHEDVGRYISKIKPDYVLGLGRYSRFLILEVSKKLGSNRVFWSESLNEIFEVASQKIDRDWVILVKGSRSMGLDKLVSRLSKNI